MGIQLREALQRLCVEIGWSYAVFWRAILNRNQMHLVWEDGHYEPKFGTPGISGFEAMDMLLKKRVALQNSRDDLFPEPGCQIEDRVRTLVYKTMAPQVHIVGDGIVGLSALTGNHQWIVQDFLSDYGSVPKVLAEMNHQFLAGIQTIAMVPVLPYGVLQLGSTQMVMENIGFIHHVRSLFTQLGCVPAALVSDVNQKPLSQNHVRAFLGIPTSLAPSEDSGTSINRFSSLPGDGCNQQPLKGPDSRSVVQPVCSLFTQNTSEVSPASTIMPISEFSQLMTQPVVEPIQHGHLESGPVGAHIIFSRPGIRSIRSAAPHDLSSGGNHQSQILAPGLSSRSLTLVEEQLLSISGSWESANKGEPKLDNSRTVQLRPHGYTSSSYPKDYNNFDPNESPNNIDDHGRFTFSPDGTIGSSRNWCPVPPNTEVHQLLEPTDHSNSSRMLSGDFQSRSLTPIQNSQIIPPEGQQEKDNNLFQALDVTSTEFNEQCYSFGSLTVTQDCWLSSSNPVQENKSRSAVCVESNICTARSKQNIEGNGMSECLQDINEKTSPSPVQPTSANDLFDLLYLSNKSGGFNGSLDGALVHSNDADAHELTADVSTCITQPGTGPVYNAPNDEIYCSRLFSEASPDQLLDAVVAQVNSGGKQNLGDIGSYKTSLTRIRSSSLHTSSSEQIPGDCLGRSVFVKSEAAGSSSVISACSIDKTGGCSQKDAGYISQMSLWVDNGHNVNCDSISAAHCRRIDEVGKLNRKRAKPGENPRPRPKDRQMIQDRVKELREIIPNGAKCSIDALLEKTIKHMLFLQSVTKHADKLMEVGEPKIMTKEGGLVLKDNIEGGATWAFEVGTQSMICPIIVEDLNSPRQMLVEMLCEERGFFLEIADLIRGLGLTILKGVMEARNDKVWARFAVEGNKDVTRMEVFLSLVRLLEPNSGSSMAQRGVENLNIPRNMFQPSSIPATGISDRFR